MLEDEPEEALRERDDAEDFIDELLDEVLGVDRPEWSSAYNRYDAMNDVRERITALHKPAVDRAWKQFAAGGNLIYPFLCRTEHIQSNQSFSEF